MATEHYELVPASGTIRVVRRAQQLGRYHLLDRIAFGGMAEIYRAKTFDANGHAHLVAVKRVLAHLAEDDDFIQMLVDEAKIASMLKHRNIARVYEFARAHGEYFIAMEHVDGKDLRSILERCRQQKRPIPPQHAAYVAMEISSALHAAHTAVDNRGQPLRIVHRDVSPSNVISAYTGEVKLCDFGIAKATLSKVNTKTGVIKGKVKYMTPEQALGRRLDHRSDLFSLGTCLYEMLTRLPPFTASNEMDLLIKVRDAKYRPITDVVPSVPRELEGIADRCLTRSRAHRYQTADEVAQALREFLSEYMPNYSRSHLGRYVRKQFAGEIERELRMLEEYVVEDTPSEDVGENLIANVMGPDAQYSQFTPRPTNVGNGFHHSGIRTPVDFDDEAKTRDRLPSRSDAMVEGDDYHPRQHRSSATTLPRHSTSSDESDFNIHKAQTLILDKAHEGQLQKPSHAAEVRAVDELGNVPEEYDEALHNAPTLILDSTRKRKKRRGGRR